MLSVRLMVCLAIGFGLVAGSWGQTATRLEDRLQAALDQALQLRKKGETAAARKALDDLIPQLRDSAKSGELLGRALTGAAELAMTAGDYAAATRHARQAIEVHQQLADWENVADDWNRIGLAGIYQGDYQGAIEAYQQALAIDRKIQDREGEVVRLYNLGNVYFELGRYQDAYRSYRGSLDRIEAAPEQAWYLHRRQIAMVNLAILYQRLGRYQQALDQYRSLGDRSAAAGIPASQRAQILANQGTLYRRLGDPVKALEAYREAETLFARERHPFGEVGALKNIGIALALDLDRMPEALRAFESASRVAAVSAKSQLPSLQLYLAEALRVAGDRTGARTQFTAALTNARQQGSREYEWRALFGLGQLAEESGDRPTALAQYLEAIRTFETLRSGLDMPSLKREFLADKREVYDAAISVLLHQPDPPKDHIFELMENSRSRILQDSLGSNKDRHASLKRIQEALAPGGVLLEFWNGRTETAVLSITRTGVDLARRPKVDTTALWKAVQDPGRGAEWQSLAKPVGSTLLSDLRALADPQLQCVMIVPDGALASIPFELLPVPGRGGEPQLLLDRAPVYYLPAAGALLRGHQHPQPWWRRWRWPWNNQLAVLGDPSFGSGNAAERNSAAETVAAVADYAPLPYSRDEAQAVAASASGRAELYLGDRAQKRYLRDAIAKGFAGLHLSTHAVADLTDPERSRIVLAAADSDEQADFLFLREIYGMDLRPVDLVVLSACSTETGKLVGGEGVESFGRAFITAGARSAVTTLWRVDDAATSQLMQQFYYQLGRGKTKAEALQLAKQTLLSSGTALAHPAYWAGFVLNGDGDTPAVRFVSWTQLAVVAMACACLLFLLLRRKVAVQVDQ